jgi:hypothetical protein
MENVIVPPDPRRLIYGLRDTGYSFNVAVADLVDNSISAGASQILIYINMDYIGQVSLKIIDNGSGMDREALIDAMKYGSRASKDPRSLSKFGLGMKTASSAFCRSLSVVSRGVASGVINKATWDLDHVMQVGEWELILDTPAQEEIYDLTNICGEGTGTLVSWSKVDRLLKDYADPGGRSAVKALNKSIDELKEHMSMVYQRFLDVNDDRELQKVKIFVNDEQIDYWDPFCEDIVQPAQEQEVEVKLEDDGDSIGKFMVRAFILPRKEEFPDLESAARAKISNERQGFYIYRENRLIHDSDWMGMYTMEPHGSLLRVEFSFKSDLDDAFQVDIKKSRIALNSAMSAWVKDAFLPPVRRAADEVYRKGQKKENTKNSKGAHDRSNRNIENKEKDIDKASVEVIDPASGQARVSNQQGTTTLRLKIELTPRNPGELYVVPVDSIVDGLLWEPALIENNQGVQINRGHPYYQKVYMPSILNRDTSVGTIEGMDALLYALSIAELKTVNPATQEHFSDLRFEVSRILRKLVESLPDPPEVNGNGN